MPKTQINPEILLRTPKNFQRFAATKPSAGGCPHCNAPKTQTTVEITYLLCHTRQCLACDKRYLLGGPF